MQTYEPSVLADKYAGRDVPNDKTKDSIYFVSNRNQIVQWSTTTNRETPVFTLKFKEKKVSLKKRSDSSSSSESDEEDWNKPTINSFQIQKDGLLLVTCLGLNEIYVGQPTGNEFTQHSSASTSESSILQIIATKKEGIFLLKSIGKSDDGQRALRITKYELNERGEKEDLTQMSYSVSSQEHFEIKA